MIPCETYINNLILTDKFRDINGCIVECGTWRGGMIGGMAKLIGNEKKYYLYDSFEGLPDAKEIDGKKAQDWQKNKESAWYHENCKADIKYAKDAMSLAEIPYPNIIKGWFSETLLNFPVNEKIAILRLDGDWYESTITCLNSLYHKVEVGGIIIIDDYLTWDGCSKAIHDFLSKSECNEKVRQFNNDVSYIIKS